MSRFDLTMLGEGGPGVKAGAEPSTEIPVRLQSLVRRRGQQGGISNVRVIWLGLWLGPSNDSGSGCGMAVPFYGSQGFHL